MQANMLLHPEGLLLAGVEPAPFARVAKGSFQIIRAGFEGCLRSDRALRGHQDRSLNRKA